MVELFLSGTESGMKELERTVIEEGGAHVFQKKGRKWSG